MEISRSFLDTLEIRGILGHLQRGDLPQKATTMDNAATSAKVYYTICREHPRRFETLTYGHGDTPAIAWENSFPGITPAQIRQHERQGYWCEPVPVSEWNPERDEPKWAAQT